MLDQVISKIEENTVDGKVRTSVIDDCIKMLEGEEGDRAQRAKDLLREQTTALPQGKSYSEMAPPPTEQKVPVEHILGALRALFESQDD